MNDEIVIIDQAYKYQVDEILNGGIGYIRLMSLKEFSRKPPDVEGNHENSETKYPYRNQLAAKTIKNIEGMDSFARACDLWLGLNEPGIAPLLKVVKNGNEVLALMPRYAGSLRALMQSGPHNPKKLLKALYQAVSSLSKVNRERGIVHQAIKPENFLYSYRNNNLVFELSDWGITKVQASLLSGTKSERLKTLDNFGMIHYLAPDRFDNYISDIRADVFSLGMILFEIITGELPYDVGKSVAEQIASGFYFDRAKTMLMAQVSQEVVDLILQMIHPLAEKRILEYGKILKFISCFERG